MPNPNPHQARRTRKRRAKAGTIKQLNAVLWEAVTRLEDALQASACGEDEHQSEEAVNRLCKLTHALSQTASTYIRAVEAGELEARVAALEEAEHARVSPNGVPNGVWERAA